MKECNLSVIVPVHNEENRIARTLDDCLLYFSKEYRDNFEIILVLNECADRTQDIVNTYNLKYPQIIAKVFHQRIGKGGAIKEGVQIANGDVILVVDADGSTSPDELHKLLRELRYSDATIGSRWLPGSNIGVKQSFTRRIASRGFNLLVRTLLGLHLADTQCGAKAFKKVPIAEVLKQVGTTNFAFDVELLYRMKRSGYMIKEIPITWEDKAGSKVDLKKAVPSMFLALVKLRLLDSPFGYIIRKFNFGRIPGQTK